MSGSVLFCAVSWLIAGGGGHPLLDPDFQWKLNAQTNSVCAVSDEIDVLVDGKESYPVRWRMLENAKKTIYFTTMYIFNDETTKRLRDLLVRKKNEGVDIRIIIYGPYSLGNPGFDRYVRKHGIPLKKYSGVGEVALRNPRRFWTRHLHDKYLVVDGQEAVLGGMNWSSRYESGGSSKGKEAWRDTDVYIRGPQAEIIEKEFLLRWYRDEYPEKCRQVSLELADLYRAPVYPPSRAYGEFVPETRNPEHLTRFLYQQPFEQSGEAYITHFFKETIDRAQDHVWWQSIATRPAPIQHQALIDAARRGVDVRLMTNSKRNMCMIPIGGLPLYILTRMGYKDLLEGGVRIFEYSGDAPMHSKGFVVDGVVAVIGSYNATFTAEKYYTESSLALYDARAIREVHDMFEQDFAHCKEVTIDGLEH